MIARNCSREDLELALAAVNVKYHDNVKFKRLDPNGRGWTFTLTVRNTRGKGGASLSGVRKSESGFNPEKLVSAACWHVHGEFFNALFALAPDARIFSSFYKRSNSQRFEEWITKDTPWHDGQIGSNAYPTMYSEACTCND